MLSKQLSTAAAGLITAIAFAAPALASDRDEESFTISVTIAPFAEAIVAQEAGAVGGWTIFQEGGGLMIEAPNKTADGAMTIHYGERNRLQLFSGGRVIVPTNIRVGNGLTAASYQADNFSTTGLWTSEVILSGL